MSICLYNSIETYVHVENVFSSFRFWGRRAHEHVVFCVIIVGGGGAAVVIGFFKARSVNLGQSICS